MHKILILAACLLLSFTVSAQELNAKVSVMAGQIKSSVNRNVFQTLQTALTNFLNNRKWTNDSYRQQEKIVCHFLLNITQDIEPNVYRAVLTIQAGRPVYNSSYISPLLNFQDNDVSFKYIEFQQVEFNESNITGSDPAASNLTAIFAYYVYMILGLDYDSFSPRGGDLYFKRAQNIVSGAPDGRNITGWKAFDGQRNRYWLAENFTNSKYSLLHDAYYAYYRLGMDKMYEDENLGRAAMLQVLKKLDTYNSDNPNTMINQFFFQGKSTELVNIFKKALPQDKATAKDILPRIDITNAAKYQDALK